MVRNGLKFNQQPIDIVYVCQTNPADGQIVLCGEVIDGELEQIKGVFYSLHGFIGPLSGSLFVHSTTSTTSSGQLKAEIGDGLCDVTASLLTSPGNRLYQCVVYLAPGEYHHFHSPADWVVTGRRHFPGTLSLHFNGHFPGRPGFASTRMSPLWILWGNGDGHGGDNWSFTMCKTAVKSSPPTNQHPMFYGPDALPVTQSIYVI